MPSRRRVERAEQEAPPGRGRRRRRARPRRAGRTSRRGAWRRAASHGLERGCAGGGRLERPRRAALGSWPASDEAPRRCPRASSRVEQPRRTPRGAGPPPARATRARNVEPARPGPSGPRSSAGAVGLRRLATVDESSWTSVQPRGRPSRIRARRSTSVMAAFMRLCCVAEAVARSSRRAALSDERLLDFLREMLLIRRFEEKVEERFRAGELPGFLHVAIGQEAVAVGVCRALEDGDVIASTHRAHAHALAQGTHPNELMAELYGKIEGCSRGYGGSMHLYDVARGNLGANAVVGGGCPRSPAPRSPSSSAASRASRSPSSATARRTSAPSTSRSTSPSSGRCRRSSSARTTTTPSRRPAGSSCRSRPLEARRRVRHAHDDGRRPGRRGGLPGRAAALEVRARRARGRSSCSPRPTASPATTSATRRSTGRRTRCASSREHRTRSTSCARGSRSADEEWEALEREVAEHRRGLCRVREERHRPAARRRPEERLRLMAELTVPRGGARRDGRRRCARDPDVFVMGEDIAEMGGSMGVTQGMLAGVRRRSGCATRRSPRWRSSAPASAPRCRACARSSRSCTRTSRRSRMEQIVNQAAKHRYMSGGQLKVPLTIRTQGGAGWSPGAQHAQQLEAWFVHVPGLKVVFPSTPGGRTQPALGLDLRRQPRALLRAPAALPGQGRGPRGDRADPVRQGAHPPRGRRRHRRRHRAARPRGAEGGRRGRGGGHLGRGLRPAHAAAARRGRARRLGQEDEPLRRRARGGRRGWASAPRSRPSCRSRRSTTSTRPSSASESKFTPLPFAPVMEQFVVPHAADVLGGDPPHRREA